MNATSIRYGLVLALLTAAAGPARADLGHPIPGGELHILTPDGPTTGICPLRHTDVQADITGFVGRVRLQQVFYNPLDRKIEAVYVFPRPDNAAVDDMVMTVGDRRIIGQIKPRDQARQIYEAARANGHVAGLLDQERPNILTQSVVNIEPGVEIIIEISYVQTLGYDNGVFEFVFPMVVGPRYIPGGGSAPAPMTTGQPTPQVPDAHRITPPVTPNGTRAGHDISLTVNIDAGREITLLKSTLHQVDIQRPDTHRALVSLTNRAEIPNQDFVLRYRTDADTIGDAFFVHTDPRGTFFTMLLQPPQRIVPDQVVPREIIFVLDTSGSMRGFPIDKAKEVMAKAIDAMRPRDTFNLITFAGQTRILWNTSRPNTPDNRAEAQAFLASRRGGGGTEMMKAINAALVQNRTPGPVLLTPEELADLPADGRAVVVRLDLSRTEPRPMPNTETPAHGVYIILDDGSKVAVDFGAVRPQPDASPTGHAAMVLHGRWVTRNRTRILEVDTIFPAGRTPAEPMRIVCFMTDGFVGNDMAIIDAIKKNVATTRVFSFGVGNSTNRFLLDGMARAGRGEVEYVTLKSDAESAVARFCERISAPLLADITLDWGSLSVSDVRPANIPDLFSTRPIMVHGRLNGTPTGTITLRGRTGAGPFQRVITVTPASVSNKHDVLASLWARTKIDDLMMQDYTGLQHGHVSPDLERQITELGVEFRLMTQFTSFVAVEETTKTVDGEPMLVLVPVEMPHGVSYDGVFGSPHPQPAKLAMGRNKHMFARLGRASGASLPNQSAPLSPRRESTISVGGVPSSAPPQPTTRGARGWGLFDKVQSAFQSVNSSIPREPAGLFAAMPVREREHKELNLAESLRTLADRVAKDGLDGDLTTKDLRVVDFKIEILLHLRDTSPDTMRALMTLGFIVQSEMRPSVIGLRTLIGTIDVRKLKALVKLDAVVRISPASAAN